VRYESHRCIATYACGALLAAPQPAEHCDKEMRISEAIHADLLHGAAVLSRVIDKTLLELTNVLEGICQLLLHLFQGRRVLGLFECTRVCRQV
jgi:hypothetical protein